MAAQITRRVGPQLSFAEQATRTAPNAASNRGRLLAVEVGLHVRTRYGMVSLHRASDLALVSHPEELAQVALHVGRLQIERLTESVAISAGNFKMGSVELGQREMDVTLTKGYRIGKFPVTNKLFRLYMEANDLEVPDQLQRVFDPAYGDHPVVNIMWGEAKDFCTWLTSLKLTNPQTGRERTFRLPTEAEWERACRGTSGQKYAWGDEAPDISRAVFDTDGTQPVGPGLRPAGATKEGAHDMTGNVLEWVADAFVGPDERPGGTDPFVQPSNEDIINVLHVQKGGPFLHRGEYLLGANRGPISTVGRDDDVGFRFAED